MHHSFRTIALSVTSFLIALVFPSLLMAEEAIIDLDFNKHTVTADIKKAPLRAVIEEIKKEVQGIWFKIWLGGSVPSLDERISVEFKDLSIRDGMEDEDWENLKQDHTITEDDLVKGDEWIYCDYCEKRLS
jgi:hypothetical protein